MNIWYISKYAGTPNGMNSGRQYFFSKYMVKEGAKVTLITSRSNGTKNGPSFFLKNQQYYIFDNVNIVTLNGPIINYGFNIKRIYSWIIFELRLLYWAIFKSKEKPDVIIASSLSLLTFLSGTFLKKHFKCKLICEVRDIWPLSIIEIKKWHKNNLFIRFLSLIERIGYKNADKIVGTMGNLKEHIQTINSDFVHKVEYIPTGFDKDFYIEDKDLVAKLQNTITDFSKNRFIVGYAGTIGTTNCVEQIIDVAISMQKENVCFVIIGNGVLKNELQNKLTRLNLKNVLFLGHFPKKTVPFILKSCNVLINPWLSGVDTYKFGVSPNKWIDYMYSGRPIIVSVDGYRNIINEAGCGVFTQAGDINAMVREINNYKNMESSELERIGEQGKSYLLEYMTYQVLTPQYINIINKIMS